MHVPSKVVCFGAPIIDEAHAGGSRQLQEISNEYGNSEGSESLGVAWEEEYNYSQAVKTGDTIYLSGQVSHDEEGNIVGAGDIEKQMRQCYVNIQRVLAQYGATPDNVVDEVLFVTDMETAHAAAVRCRREIFSGPAVVASTIVQIGRLALPELLIEIKCVARV